MLNEPEKISQEPEKGFTETQLNTAIDSLAEAIFIVTPVRDNNGTITDFVYRYANKALARMSQLPKEDLIGKRVSEIIQGFTQSPLFPLYIKAVNSPEPITLLSPYFKETVAGKELGGYYDMTLTSSSDGVVIVLHDITEYKNAEIRLQESEVDFRQLFENSFDAVFLTSPDGTVRKCNPAAVQLFGYTQEEFYTLGRSVITDLSDPNLPKALEERERTGKFAGVLSYKRKAGTTFLGETSSIVFKTEDGSLRTSTVVRDITGRILIQNKFEETLRRLQEKEANLNEAQRLAHVGSFTIELPAMKFECTEELYRIYGLDPKKGNPS